MQATADNNGSSKPEVSEDATEQEGWTWVERQGRPYLKVRGRSTRAEQPRATSRQQLQQTNAAHQPAWEAEAGKVERDRKLGNSFFKSGKYEAALQHYSSALQLLSSSGKDAAMLAALYSN
eukprot:scaffold187394_cov41-Prasinocladus_malaysianus.AAC.1